MNSRIQPGIVLTTLVALACRLSAALGDEAKSDVGDTPPPGKPVSQVVERALAFLETWPMTSRGHPGEKPFTNAVPITYFGSAWATLGLAQAVPAVPETPPK